MRVRPPINPLALAALLRPLAYRHSPLSPPTAFRLSEETIAMAKALDESDVGISCFVSSLPGFRGVLKQRYSDFIVNEVGCDGQIVHLTSFDLPSENPDDKEDENPPPGGKDYADEIGAFCSLCGEVDAEALRGLLEKIAFAAEGDVTPIVLSPDPDKSHRADVHNFFKRNFKFLVTDTVEGSEGNSKCIRVRYCSGERGGRNRRGKKRKDMVEVGLKDARPFDSRGSDNWPENLGKFLRFNLYKENKDTQEALGVIGNMLGIRQRSFGFAGTKDKRAVSTQRVTIFKQQARRVAALNNRLYGIRVGDFCYVREGLGLGQLLGNRFTIALRGVVADSEDTIKAAADELGRNGFINYYGLQRFGSGSVPTHLIGLALLKGEWKDAIELILDPREGGAVIRAAREQYKEHGDVDLTLRKFPRHLVAERAVLIIVASGILEDDINVALMKFSNDYISDLDLLELQCLKKCPGNYLLALKAIPRTLRMMYVHSYQSYLWNHATSIRVQKYGIAKVVLGDLVFCKEVPAGEVVEVNNSEAVDNCNDVYDCVPDTSDEVIPEINVQFVKAIDFEDLRKGIYTFEDVVLPLPGSRIVYPSNDVADLYHDMAKKDGISLTETVHDAKEFSITNLRGGYRRIMQRPIDFVWELVTYTDENEPLAETDLDTIYKRRPAVVTKEEVFINGKSGRQTNDVELDGLVSNGVAVDGSEGRLLLEDSVCNSDAQSSKLALKLGFTLPVSCYATMAIRELLKASTSVACQKAMNP